MSEEYNSERHEKISPEKEEKGFFTVTSDLSRKGKTAKLESMDNPATVFYNQFGYIDDKRPVIADFMHIPLGNYILTVIGEDKKEYVTVFPIARTSFQWW